jgi:oxygen-independent coproporphyrinogen-3 oxidase
MAEDGLVRVDADGVDVTGAGWYVVRAVAMVFDRYLRQPPSRGDDGAQPVRFSRVL